MNGLIVFVIIYRIIGVMGSILKIHNEYDESILIHSATSPNRSNWLRALRDQSVLETLQILLVHSPIITQNSSK